MENINEILEGVTEPPDSFEQYLVSYAEKVGGLINAYIPRGTHPDMNRYLYDPLLSYSANGGKRHRPLISFAACIAVAAMSGVRFSARRRHRALPYRRAHSRRHRRRGGASSRGALPAPLRGSRSCHQHGRPRAFARQRHGRQRRFARRFHEGPRHHRVDGYDASHHRRAGPRHRLGS